MAITQRAEIDCIGYDVGNDPAKQGTLSIRWAKLTFNGDTVIARENHRTTLNPGDDIDAVMAAVNADLTAQGFGAMPATDIDLIKAQTAHVWTPDVVAAYRAAQKVVGA